MMFFRIITRNKNTAFSNKMITSVTQHLTHHDRVKSPIKAWIISYSSATFKHLINMCYISIDKNIHTHTLPYSVVVGLNHVIFVFCAVKLQSTKKKPWMSQRLLAWSWPANCEDRCTLSSLKCSHVINLTSLIVYISAKLKANTYRIFNLKILFAMLILTSLARLTRPP